MADLIRSAVLTHYPEVARSVGVDPKAMLKKVRLPLACLDQPNLRIAVRSVRRLLEMTAEAAGIDEFGLRMAERGGLTNLGPVALVVREQATVGAAIEALARYIHLHHQAMSLRIDRRRDVVVINQFLRGTNPRPSRQSTEMALGTLHHIIRSLFSGRVWHPLDVHFVHNEPRNVAYYERFFGCRITFNSDFDAIVCAADDMDYPIPTADPQIARYVQSDVDAIDQRSDKWDTKVGELVRNLLPSGHCTVQRVSELLGVDRRTIHRNLAECHTSFTEILDAERTSLVMRLLEDSNRPLAGMPELLGFSAQSAMARWFRQRFGCTLSEWRSGVRPATEFRW